MWFFSQQKPGCVFISQSNSIIAYRKKIHTLCECYLCRTGKLSQAQLNMPLVTHGFLALPTWINVFEYTSINGRMKKMVNSIVKHFSVICKYCYGHNGVYNGTIPITIGLRIIIAHQRIINGHQHIGEAVNVFLLPA